MVQRKRFRIPQYSGSITNYAKDTKSINGLRINMLGQDVYDLYQRNVLQREALNENIDLGNMFGFPSHAGSTLYELAELQNIDEIDLESIVALLKQYRKDQVRGGINATTYILKDDGAEQSDTVILTINEDKRYSVNGVPVRSNWVVQGPGHTAEFTMLVCEDSSRYCVSPGDLETLQSEF